MIEFLSGNRIELPNHLCLKPSHLLLAQQTFSDTSDVIVVAKLYLLLLSIQSSLPDNFQELVKSIIKTALICRIEKSDPSLLELRIGSSFTTSPNNDGASCECMPSSDYDFTCLVRGIKNSTTLEAVHFDGNILDFETLQERAFYDNGFGKNNSIRSLALSNCNFSERTSILRAFGERRGALNEIAVWNCNLGSGVILTSTLQKCMHLKEIRLQGNDIEDEYLFMLVPVLRNLAHLETLSLPENRIGFNGCKALASLLEDPRVNLVSLNLCNNRIGRKGAIANNKKLECLLISGNDGIDRSVWDAFSIALCDTSNVVSTYFSNHVLKSITYDDEEETNANYVDFYLWMNREKDKDSVAIRKILEHHHLEMKSFFTLDLKLLPFVVNWFDRARECSEDCLESRNLSALYQFSLAFPVWCLGTEVTKG